ncbi:D-arabinono-1,4-lactone oxidase [Podila minutissima]|nr:D-arabinono-1,4-lactone oxidase [Podila minutissima]
MSSISKTDGFLVNTKCLSSIYKPVFDEKHNFWTVSIQSGVSIKALDDYLRNQDPPLAMSGNVFLEPVLYGGIIAIGAHGAEINGRCLSDQVTEISIVDGTGTLQTFNADKDPIEFSAACVSLGLLGIIYTLTLKVIPMAETRYHALDYNCSDGDDFANVVRAWDHVVKMVYEAANERNEYPLSVAMEARFNKASRCIMSQIYDDDPEAVFFSIELVSGKNTPGFLDFSEKIAKIWMEQYGGL